jgi:carboxymethylenebutenolidase
VVNKVIHTLALIAVGSYCFAQDIVVDTVIVQCENLKLKGLLWRPNRPGKLPTVIFCHGGYETAETTYDLVENISTIGSVFAKRGYVFLGLCRRGIGLSKGQGVNGSDLMAEAFNKIGQEGRNKVQLEQLQTDQLTDMLAGLAFLRKRKEVDTNRVVVMGHSFGGSLALLVAEHDHGVKAVVVFSAAGYSWDRSPQLRLRLISAVRNIPAPIMIVHAHNDYSLNPGYGLDSVMTALHKPHVLKIYPEFGKTNREAHNLILLGTQIWETDVFKFLDAITKQ